MPRYEFELYADAYIFFIQDERSGADQIFWSDEAHDRKLAVAPGVVAVSTVFPDMVDVIVDLLDVTPPSDFDDWDHVVECSLSISNGRILAAGWRRNTPDAVYIKVRSGNYRVRVSYSILDSFSVGGLKERANYLIQVWPSTAIEPIILKKCMA